MSTPTQLEQSTSISAIADEIATHSKAACSRCNFIQLARIEVTGRLNRHYMKKVLPRTHHARRS